MASAFQFALFLCLASGLMAGKHCSKDEPSSPCPVCPPGWIRFGTRCFYFSNAKKNWWDAERQCLSGGGNLASIISEKENEFILDYLNRVTKIKKSIWLGGHDAVKEEIWFWNDGKKMDFTRWGDNRPSHSKKKNCLEMDVKKDSWKDGKCKKKCPFLCSADLPCPGKPSSNH